MRSRKLARKFLKWWSNCQNFPSYSKSGMKISNLGSNFKLEVEIWRFLCMYSKKWLKVVQNMAQMVKICVP